ncbi:MAG: sodium:alanine symporter family protein [bacterium]|nr:sodium:alanine symporter family protein [bacterium]
MDTLVTILQTISDIVWGPFLLIPLLLVTGFYLTIRIRGTQFTKLWGSLYLALIVRRDPDSEGDISHFQALMTALAATVGTGNIVGVATAIAAGGPGALFWMWMTGLVGMATKYAEALLSVKYRTRDSRGEQCGGPMYYISRGVKQTWIGKPLGALFAIFAAIAAFGIGNMVQSHSICDAVHEAFGVSTWITGAVVATLAAGVILFGIKGIGRFTGFFVPLMILLYCGCMVVLLILNIDEVPGALQLIFESAFSGTAAVGGFTGAALRQAIRFGVARGIFSNESGLGSAGIAAAAAQTKEPVRQAMVSMTQTFIDTIVVCTFTGVTIVATGAWNSGLDGAPLTQAAFKAGLPGEWGPWIIAVSLSMFAFSTILGWCYYGEKSAEYLFGERVIIPYRILFVIATFAASFGTIDLIWKLADVTNGLMALPNLVGLLLLSGVVAKETKTYFAKKKTTI